MPRFRHIAPMPHLEDHEFDADVNPDPTRFEEIVRKSKAAPVAAESTEES